MELRTGLFASLYNAMEESNPIYAHHIYEACDYRRMNLKDGHFDAGQLAFNMLYAKLFLWRDKNKGRHRIL